ncbi:hypothetical protein SAMN02910298_01693 [Pseudobutyrivibrio sp. YE44]|uniref:hypothetical protein n=1 Tax=Pseudobutyrivibrio sp. YE44 TaxID=1520802 RepID=UPI0008861BC1|nr:hypothetical protein [Pseudobutyrivibrio sp. YE44]SDB34702.1 hypothetical protein SAMN02910298_01693 [Pseudobutyrivibrio sp. YE44]
MRRKWLIPMAAFALAASIVAVKPTIAYFTDTALAEGAFLVNISDGTPEIEEKVTDMTKLVTIKNTGSYDIFVRCKAIYPETRCTVTFQTTEGWSDGGDGYYYYAGAIAPGETTPAETPLTLLVSPIPGTSGDFNVIIVQEATKAIYKTVDGVDVPDPDWSAAVSQ